MPKLKEARIQKWTQKWKVGYGGSWRILELKAMHYGAIISLHTCCIRPIQDIQTKIEARHLKKNEINTKK